MHLHGHPFLSLSKKRTWGAGSRQGTANGDTMLCADTRNEERRMAGFLLSAFLCCRLPTACHLLARLTTARRGGKIWAGRARWGTGGALNPQPALAGLNSLFEVRPCGTAAVERR